MIQMRRHAAQSWRGSTGTRRLALKPRHLFERDGRKFVFDVTSTSFVLLNDIAWEHFRHEEAGWRASRIRRWLAAHYPQRKVRGFLRELDAARQHGYFKRHVTTFTEEENEAYFRSLTEYKPRRLTLYLAEACNMRCRYCYVRENQALDGGLMPLEVAKAAVDYLFRAAGDRHEVGFVLFGGEPLLNRRVFFWLLDYSQRLKQRYGLKRVSYSMTTNGSLLTDDMIDAIVAHDFSLLVSFDGPKPIQDVVRPFADGRGSFDVTVERIRRLMTKRPDLAVRCTLSRLDLNKTEIVRFLEELGFRRVAVSYCTGRAHSLGPLDIGPEGLLELRRHEAVLTEQFFEKVARGEPIRYDSPLRAIRDIYERSVKRLRCGVGRGTTAVSVLGKLYPCHRYVGMDKYIIGDVWSGIDKEAYIDYLREYFSTKKVCESCWAIHLCGGLCPWYVSREDGPSLPPPSWTCDDIRDWFEAGAAAFVRLSNDHPRAFRRLVQDAKKYDHAVKDPDEKSKPRENV